MLLFCLLKLQRIQGLVFDTLNFTCNLFVYHIKYNMSNTCTFCQTVQMENTLIDLNLFKMQHNLKYNNKGLFQIKYMYV